MVIIAEQSQTVDVHGRHPPINEIVPTRSTTTSASFELPAQHHPLFIGGELVHAVSVDLNSLRDREAVGPADQTMRLRIDVCTVPRAVPGPLAQKAFYGFTLHSAKGALAIARWRDFTLIALLNKPTYAARVAQRPRRTFSHVQPALHPGLVHDAILPQQVAEPNIAEWKFQICSSPNKHPADIDEKKKYPLIFSRMEPGRPVPAPFNLLSTSTRQSSEQLH